MPIYMDLHIIPGVKAKDVANAHLMDVMIQKEHSCTCMTFWIDEARGHVFCLIDAPAKEVVTELHDKAHGLVPHKIIEVEASLVESFLGRVSDPTDAPVTDEGLTLINDPSFRVLLVIRPDDPVLLQGRYGKQRSAEIKGQVNHVMREQLHTHGGMEAEHDGPDFIASFTSAGKAFSCASGIQQHLMAIKELNNFRIAINAGEPVTANEKLFGDTIQLAKHMCFIAKARTVSISSAVQQLVFKEQAQNNEVLFMLAPPEEQFLELLLRALEDNWQDSEFNMEDYCLTMAMSKSQLYRKTIALSGLSPNALLKEFRLEKGKELLKKRSSNISQITFGTGFSSPSYFTKCFKKKYGILPMAYHDLLR